MNARPLILITVAAAVAVAGILIARAVTSPGESSTPDLAPGKGSPAVEAPIMTATEVEPAGLPSESAGGSGQGTPSGRGEAAKIAPPSSQTPAPGPPTALPGGPGGTPFSGRRVTLTENNAVIQLRVGETFLLYLGQDRNWTVSVDNTAVVTRVMSVVVIQGAQGIYEARAAGRAVLTATGDLPCRSVQPPCLAPSLLFRITVVVDP